MGAYTSMTTDYSRVENGCLFSPRSSVSNCKIYVYDGGDEVWYLVAEGQSVVGCMRESRYARWSPYINSRIRVRRMNKDNPLEWEIV